MATAPHAPAPLAINTSTNTLHNFQPSQNSASPGHKRTYQACIPCRRRKVRCELGPVDAPQDPPCARCRRESKECHFSATRRKRKAEDDESDVGEDEHTGDEFAARNGRRKSTRTSGSLGGYETGLQDPRRSMTSGSLSAISQIDGYSVPPQGPLQPPDPYSTDNTITKSEDGQDHEVTNETAAEIFRTPINIPGDALHLLLKASNQSEDIQRREIANQGRRPTSHPMHGSSSAQGSHHSRRSPTIQRQGAQGYSTNIDPAIGSRNTEHRETSLSAENLKLWSRLRFVHAGWFTVSEAISYIDYFYEHLNPLTPISLPACRPDIAHSALLKEEPMLTVTILTIASRYKELAGPGAQTRAFKIHEKLWEHLRDMITRMFWGQEQFGGGFCGAGKRKVAPNGALGGLRSLGTIESLLLLSEFHPKSMHFPPRDDDGEILIPAEEEWTDADLDTTIDKDITLGGWSEPVARSDQMCRSLIGMAYVLAYELGIFGDYVNGIVPVEKKVQTHNSTANQRLREERVERALYIFTTQASGRFGLPSIYSDQVNRFSLDNFLHGSHSIDSTMLSEPVDRSQQCWVDLMSIMKETNRVLFPSKDHTALLVQNGTYMSQLDRIQPMLLKWHKMFEKLDVPKYPRLIISIEYHYISLYINSLALQAVIEQWANKVSSMPQVDSPASPASSISSSYVNMHKQNERYIREVISSARTVLKAVVEGFLPNDYLKHAPVRTIFRILTSATFLLKTFAIGGKADEVSISRRLLADTAKALRTSYVDDVHVCLRVANLLEGLIEKVGEKFVRLPPRTQEPLAQYNSSNTYNQQAQFQYHPSPGDTIQNPLDGLPITYDSLRNKDITIMPPLGNSYFSSNNPGYNFHSPSSYNSTQQQQNQESYAMNNDGADTTDFGMPPDWLTLDLNGLVNQTGINGNGGYEWLGAFGPETQNNLEVLGKLSNGRYPGADDYGDGGGMNF